MAYRFLATPRNHASASAVGDGVLEGHWSPLRLVILEFPDRAAAALHVD